MMFSMTKISPKCFVCQRDGSKFCALLYFGICDLHRLPR
jgi:hypothetical protein